ncbi:MAG: DEAD/DEAH box helicase [Anaerolineaceae bacterium]
MTTLNPGTFHGNFHLLRQSIGLFKYNPENMALPTESAILHLINAWKNEPTIQENIVEWHTDNPQAAHIFTFPETIHPKLIAALRQRGYDGLYTHQISSWQASRAGQNMVIVTGTASGKTLCFNLPVLNSILSDPDGCALYIYPTKALAQDQKEILTNLVRDTWDGGVDLPPVSVYDGDTPGSHRANIRSKVHLLMTNPDMLHISILPHHTLWSQFFKNLRFIIIDEIHIYRGVFGSHVANVIRRLKRIANFYGAHPQFILTSATIANPAELAERLVEEPVTLIDQDGSPHSKKNFLLYNPPIVNPDLGIRRSSLAESSRLAGDLLAYGIQTILFVRSRRAVELLLRDLQTQQPDSMTYLHGYRSGYLAQERRAIEKSLRDKKSLAVVATSALELGIDIGSIGAIILAGYPGSISATRQRTGRAGRREEDALAVMVASSTPLDQFLVKHPEYLFGRSPEKALINPDNLLILLHHLKSAAFELPIRKNEAFGRLPMETLNGLLDYLEQIEVLHLSGNRYYWMADQYPANDISLRSASGSTFTLQAIVDDIWKTVGEVDQESALWMVHPNAIYMHEGETYRVEELDLENKLVKMLPSEVDYFTIPHSRVDIDRLSILHEKEVSGGHVFYGDILVTEQVTGYRRIHWTTRENLGDYPLDLPSTELRTVAYWLSIDRATVEKIQEKGLWKNEANDYGSNWSLQKKMARMRDHFTCQMCGTVEQDQAHHVHHKVPFKEFISYEQANQLDNLITLCPTCHRRAELVIKMRSGLAGLGYVMQQISPLFLMCDSTDLGVYFDSQAALGDKQPTVAIYDQIPGGIGLSEEAYRIHDKLIQHSLELVRNCECQEGCPACVGPAGENGIGGKQETLAILEELCHPET